MPDVKQAAIGGRRERIRLTATCPARSTRRPGAGSAPAAGWPRTSAPRHEPPLLQIGPRHKVACHFAGEAKSEGAIPMTLSALGCNSHGDAIAGESAEPNLDDPGYSADYKDLETRRRESAQLADR